VSHRYTLIFGRQPDGGFHTYCPALPACHSQGDTLDEAKANVREAVEAYLNNLKTHGEPTLREELVIQPVEIAV
jgi:predicted RNase H-like HicB family nuclease